MRIISHEELEDLAIGAKLLGSGGGGDPASDLLIAKQAFEDFGSPNLLSLEEIEDEAYVVPVAFMGAPLVCLERIASGKEFGALVAALKKETGKEADYFVAGEIGGSNAFAPLIGGAFLGLRVVDGDTIGRAFPELQMSSCNLFRIMPGPAILSDHHGRTVTVQAQDAPLLENQCRKICLEMGSSCALAAYVMTGAEAKKSLIGGSVSRAIALGGIVRQSSNPIASLVSSFQGRILAEGMIVDIDQKIEGGFLKGMFQIAQEKGSGVSVYYQNEYLAAYEDGMLIAATPDILIPLEQSTAKPVSSESLQYGIRVVLLSLPAPALWSTPEGLALVGPEYFNIKPHVKERL